jgi:PAS domain S-box-containing protein
MQEQLYETKHRYQDLFDSAPVAYLSVDTAGKIQSSNDAAQRLFGYSASELHGMEVVSLVVDDVKEKVQCMYELVKQGKTVKTQIVTYVGKQRQERYCLLSLTLLKNVEGTVIASRNTITGYNLPEDIQPGKEENQTCIGEYPCIDERRVFNDR